MEPKRLRATLVLLALAGVGFASLWVVIPLVLDKPSPQERAAVEACVDAVSQARDSPYSGVDVEEATRDGWTWTVTSGSVRHAVGSPGAGSARSSRDDLEPPANVRVIPRQPDRDLDGHIPTGEV
jgi:hypothetical protein